MANCNNCQLLKCEPAIWRWKYLEEAKFIGCLVRTDDERLNISNIDVPARNGDG